MKSINKYNLFYFIFYIVEIISYPCNVFGQVKYYNAFGSSIYWMQDYKNFKIDSFPYFNFNTKPVSRSLFKLNLIDSNKVGHYPELYCDSLGLLAFVKIGFAYFDKNANRIPLNFSKKENEILYSRFFTNKTKYIFSLLSQMYRPPGELTHNGYTNFIRFDKNYKLIDTVIIKEDFYNRDNMLVEYSSNCDFNLLLYRNIINKNNIEFYYCRIDSNINKNASLIYKSNYGGDLINCLSPKGDIIIINNGKLTNKYKKNYCTLYPFNNQKIKIDIENPIFNAQVEINNSSFSSDGQFLFLIRNDSVYQYSLRIFQKDSIYNSKKLIGILKSPNNGFNQFSNLMLLPDENIYFVTSFGKRYLIKKINDTFFEIDSIFNYDSNSYMYSSVKTALYHPHFRIETKDTFCIGEKISFKTNHIDSFANYQWIIKDDKNNILLNSHTISTSFSASQPGHYRISLIYRWRCNSMDSTFKDFYIKEPSKIDKIRDSIICFNGIFSTEIPKKFINVSWSNNENGNNFETNKQGIYVVNYTDGCQNFSDTFEIKVIDELKYQISNSPIILCSVNESYTTNLHLPDFTNYKWQDNFGSLNRTISMQGNFNIEFYNKCQSITETINVLYSEKKTEIYIPNAITPNGDLLNENWEINDPLNVKEVHWIISNRWGEKIDEGRNTTFDLNKVISITKGIQGIYLYKFLVTFHCNNISKIYTGLFHVIN